MSFDVSGKPGEVEFRPRRVTPDPPMLDRIATLMGHSLFRMQSNPKPLNAARDCVNPPVRVEVDGAIATTTLNSAATRNALTPQMPCLLADAVMQFAEDDALRAAIVTGAGARGTVSSRWRAAGIFYGGKRLGGHWGAGISKFSSLGRPGFLL